MYVNFLIENILPDIVDMWPSNFRDIINLKVQKEKYQQHTKEENPDFFAAVHAI